MQRYTKQFNLSAIHAFFERGFGVHFIAEHLGMDPSLLRPWVEVYRLHGMASLTPHGKDHSPSSNSHSYRRSRSGQSESREAS